MIYIQINIVVITKNYILGTSCYYHDIVFTLLCDGEIIAAAQEERFTRKKHDSDFPAKTIKYCLHSQGIDLRDIKSIIYYEKPIYHF